MTSATFCTVRTSWVEGPKFHEPHQREGSSYKRAANNRYQTKTTKGGQRNNWGN
jgi:hypothetical protein